MKMGFRLSCAGLAALMLMAVPAAAKQCKEEMVSATSREYISRSLGAFPGSWAAWRKEVKDKVGNGWQAWRRAEDRKISCDQDSSSRRWVCTRTARPCRPGDGPDHPDQPENACVDCPPIDKVLRRGMNDDQVRTLQYLLKEEGYNVVIDGDFGSGTERALRDFQRKSRLKVDGRAGPATIEALTS
jgi:hypothetical protein